jgi:hypothetical protein
MAVIKLNGVCCHCLHWTWGGVVGGGGDKVNIFPTYTTGGSVRQVPLSDSAKT